ncbi:MAG: cytochrome c oxidase subunit 3 [Janthinobacterium lividum]
MPADVAGSIIGAPVGIETLEQFNNPAQQKRAAELGMWAWLLTELLLFGGLFLIALVLRYQYPDSVHAAALHLKFWIGATNTAILICSSLTMSGAIMLSRLGGQRWMIRCMLATAALGSLFLVLKGYEWFADWQEHMTPFLPGPYALEGDAQSRLFVNLYFVTTALHGLHLTTGVAILLGLTWMAKQPDFLVKHQNRIEIYGLYWHFIDLIWIMAFAVLYVVGR